MRTNEPTTDVAPEEEIDLDAWVPNDEPGADLGDAYRAYRDEEGDDGVTDGGGPRVTDAYRSGS